MTFGVVLLLFCAYELWVTNIYTAQTQHRLGTDIRNTWQSPGPDDPAPVVPGPGGVVTPDRSRKPPTLGNGFAIIRVPAFGKDYAEVVVEGTGVPDLRKGPGHLRGTALPGEPGNTVISGHRTTYGAPFGNIDRLTPGDTITIETRDNVFTYRVVRQQIVTPESVEVTWPVPGDWAAVPTASLLTLTTCNPKYSARQRLVVVSELVGAAPKVPAPPVSRSPSGG